jgi:DNA-binding transcriptional MerR regulator
MAHRSKTRRRVSRSAASSRPRATQAAYYSRDALRALGRITEDQLRLWEFEELIAHTTMLEIEGHHEPVYNLATLRRIRTIRSLAEDLGVNLPGIGVILHLLDQMSSR